MGGQWNDDLRRRQQTDDVGHAVLGQSVDGKYRRPWLPVLVSAVVLVVGLVLWVWGPLPELGLFIVVGGALATAITGVMAIMGPDNTHELPPFDLPPGGG